MYFLHFSNYWGAQVNTAQNPNRSDKFSSTYCRLHLCLLHPNMNYVNVFLIFRHPENMHYHFYCRYEVTIFSFVHIAIYA